MALRVKNQEQAFTKAALNIDPSSGYWFALSRCVLAGVKVLKESLILGW